jgi:hypothetical protein
VTQTFGHDGDDSARPIEARLPAEAGASPTELLPAHVDAGAEPAWYLPGLAETARLLGWRWVYFVPAVGLLVLVFWIPARPYLFQFLVPYWKLWIIAVAVPTGVAINAAKHVIRSRKEPFCIHCGYGLSGLPDGHTCPECGRGYSHRIIDEYRRDPHWFIKRYRLAASLPKPDAPFEARVVSGARRKRSRDGT